MSRTIEADYLVVGAGAMGLAFIDTLVDETDATVVVVDRNDRPGGHWTTAYPFVRLHQPSAYYGVNSRKLGSDTIDQGGLNAGYYELASGAEVCAYFDAVMNQRLLPSGRVTYLPMSEYLGDGRVRTLAGDEIEVTARRVVTSHIEITVPSMREPSYAIAPGVECVPPNDLPRIRDARDRYVIVGAGKTAMDACLWLLRHEVPASRLTWIKPRESWILDRAGIQPGSQFSKRVLRDFSNQFAAVNDAESLPDLFVRLEAKGSLMRIDQSVEPTMYRCAILSQAELEALRRIDDVVRMGHVVSRSSPAASHSTAAPATSTPRRSTSTAAPTVWLTASRPRCSPTATSRCRPCAPASPRSAPLSSATWKPPTQTMRRVTRSAARSPIRASRPTGCE